MNYKLFKNKALFQDGYELPSKDRLADKLSKLFLGFITILLSFVVISLIAAMALYKETGTCELVADRPSANLVGLLSVASPDKTSLANIDAYIEFGPKNPDLKKPETTFMSLNLQNLTNIGLSDMETKLIFETSCGNLTLKIRRTEEFTTIEGVDVDLIDRFSISRRCSFQFPQVTILDPNTHYLCDLEQRMDCTTDEKENSLRKSGLAVAKVVIYRLEYEIDGDSWKIAQGLFSKPAKYCSVNESLKHD